MKDAFRSVWGGNLYFSWQLGLFLIALYGIPRFILVLGANITGNYGYTSLLFLAMWLLPLLLLNKKGWKLIGFEKPSAYIWLVWSFLLGLGCCLVVYVTGKTLYGTGVENWFVYISRSYQAGLPPELGTQKLGIFLTYALIGMTFSPIGEELLYRGLIHQCFVPSQGENRASMIDSAAFAITHLAHFGILYQDGHWQFKPVAALLWVMLMYVSSRLFFYCRYRGGSIYMAITCHAGFNLAMTYFIFYHLM